MKFPKLKSVCVVNASVKGPLGTNGLHILSFRPRGFFKTFTVSFIVIME